ncbi:hypothetical protein D3C80_498480 [compost metagenome]
MGDFNAGAVDRFAIGTLECEFKDADDGIHGGANFMTHGRQEAGLGAAGVVGQVLRFL